VFFINTFILSANNIPICCKNSNIQRAILTLESIELGIPYYILESYHDLQHLSTGSNAIYSTTVDHMDAKLSLKSLSSEVNIKLWDTIDMEDVVKQLQDMHYEFHEYQKPGSYQRLWDQIKICFPDARVVNISFWGNEVEALSTQDQEVQDISICSLSSLYSEETGDINLRQYLQEKRIFCVLDALEFHHSYENLVVLHGASFNILKNENLHLLKCLTIYADQKIS